MERASSENVAGSTLHVWAVNPGIISIFLRLLVSSHVGVLRWVLLFLCLLCPLGSQMVSSEGHPV